MNTIRTKSVAILLAALLAMCAAALIAIPRAFAVDNVQLDAPTSVSDDVTRLRVDKLDPDSREYVVGATIAIIDEETGEVVDSWVTTSSAHENAKTLNIDTVYILREIEAPEGYEKAADVRFKVKATEGAGIEILSEGDDAELTESYKVNLYDKKKPSEREITVTETTNKTVSPKTGDETPIPFVATLVGVGVVLILVLQLVKRKLT